MKNTFRAKTSLHNLMFRCLLLWSCLLLSVFPAFAEDLFFTAEEVTGSVCEDSRYEFFFTCGEPGFLIPGLRQDVIPQGICPDEAHQRLIFSGYRQNGASGVLLTEDMTSGELIREVFLENTDGSVYTGHAGGVCVTETDLYLANAHRLYRIALDKLEALPASAVCRFDEEIPVPVNASYCSYAGGILWVGEFQYGTEYSTDRSHKAKTADGTYRAWTCGYRPDENGCLFSVKTEDGTAVPDLILSMTERIQGITVCNGSIYLSQSYGRRNSSLILKYAFAPDMEKDSEAVLGGISVPVWYLDQHVFEAALMAPPMTECLCTTGQGVLVLFESAASVYRTPGNASLNPMDRVFLLKTF